jgi:hypothetical protein
MMDTLDCIAKLIEIRMVLSGKVEKIVLSPRMIIKLLQITLHDTKVSDSHLPMTGNIGALMGYPVYRGERTMVL